MGYQSHFAAILTAFYENVGKVFGLAKPAPRVVYSRVAKQKMAGMVVDYLKRNPRCLEQPAVCDALRDTFTENPLPMMTALNLTVPEIMREKTAVNALREPVKPRAKQNVKPIGFEVEQTGQKVQSLSCVGFVHRDASNQAMPTAVNHPVTRMIRQVIEPAEEIASEYTREHDDDVKSRYWCEELGEFIPTPKTRNRQSGIEQMRE